MSIEIKHTPGTCCPEPDCHVGSWDGKHCRSCGADCQQCTLYKGIDKTRYNFSQDDNGGGEP